MLTQRFDTLLRRLSDAFVAYDDTPRGIQTVVALAQARARLEDARFAIRLERQRIMRNVSRDVSADLGFHLGPVFSLNHER